MRAILLFSFVVCCRGFSVSQSPRGIGSSTSSSLRSIPTSIDTFTSGIASIARLPRGVTVSKDGVSLVGPAAPFLPKIKKLYDVENSRECRAVRERITEYDLVVEQVVPACPNSRATANNSITLPTMVVEIDGKEQTFTGAVSILNFLDDKFSTAKREELQTDKSKDEEEREEDTVNMIMNKAVELITYFPGVLRAGRGSNVCSAASLNFDVPRPTKPLILYSYEGKKDPFILNLFVSLQYYLNIRVYNPQCQFNE